MLIQTQQYTQHKEYSVSDWPETLPGLNIKQALVQLGGKKTLYVRLLGMFEASHSGDADNIIEAANKEDWQAVHDLNHSLKGVSGNLAASELFDLCTAIDHKVRDDNHDLQTELAALPQAMATLLASAKLAKQLPLE
jgi:HPt (histidine-containing phosphotransfer) domain-containing protein